MDRARPLLVVGHRNPDTDSICSAIAYARFKAEVCGQPAVACRAGSINLQTRYALDTFGASDPLFLADVLPRVRDIMIPKDELVLVRSDQSLREAYDIISHRRFSFMPVVDAEGHCVGKVTALGLASLLGRLENDAPGAA
ncbi:MAG: CBS domain-containing protein, partial [Spirochaetales bacterium]